MKISIFNCCHEIPSHALTTNIFATLVSGSHNDPDGKYIGDLGGINIASDNAYTELRHQYYVWKNLLGSHDYVGFEHYRRMFFIDPMPIARLRNVSLELADFRRAFQADQGKTNLDIGPDPYDAHWEMRRQFDRGDELAVTHYIEGFDIIAQRPSETRTMEEQWKSCFPPEFWELLISAFKQASYFRTKECMVDFTMRSPSWNNMYIMSSSLFDEYMTIVMDCIGHISCRIKPLHRGWGHLSERLFNFYMFQKVMEVPTLRVGRLPYLARTALKVPALPNDLNQSRVM